MRDRTRRHGRVRALTAVLVLAAPGWAPAEEPQYEVCRTQLERAVGERFGQTVTNVLWRHIYDEYDMRRMNYGQAIVSVAECPGWHFFDVRATADTCETQAHYGAGPRYIFYRSSGGGC